MLLRRITQHLNEQNWFAVLIDFVIVVFGVFIGIQVSNWNENRAEQVRGDRIKVRLVAEFTEMESELSRHVRDVTSWIETAGELAEDIVAGSIEPNTKEFSDHLTFIRWRPAAAGSNTIAELISQGDMDILDSPGLVDALLRFDSLAKRHISNSLALRGSVTGDFDTLDKISHLAAIPSNVRPDTFSQKLAQSVATPELYLSTMNLSGALQTDLIWHQESLKRACAILQELKTTCKINAEPQL